MVIDTFVLLVVIATVIPVVLTVYLMSHGMVALIDKLIKPYELRPYLYERIDTFDLPPAHRKWFEKHTPEFERLEFEWLGDFLMRQDARPCISRCFLSASGESIACICYWNSTRTCCISSLAADGTYIEHSWLTVVPPLKDKIPYYGASTRTTVAALVETHDRVAHQLAARRGTEILPMQDDEWREVLNYGQRVMAQIMHEEGLLPELPEFVKRSAGKIDDAASRPAMNLQE